MSQTNNKATFPHQVSRISDFKLGSIHSLLKPFQLSIKLIEANQTIPGSYWGDSEAGLINNILYVRPDTPIHSLLHEACHYICMDPVRRKLIDTNAEGDYNEENAVCYLQILLAERLANFSSNKMMQDMDAWGYTFRLGSAEAWFKEDAEDALAWLKKYCLLDSDNQLNYKLRLS